MVAPVRSIQLLDLPDEVLDIVMQNKNPGQLALVCNRFRELANGENLYFYYLGTLQQRLGIPGYNALLGRLSIIEGPASYLKNGAALSLKGVMKEIFIDQKTRIKGHWGGAAFINNLQVRFEDNVFDPFRYVAAEHWIANQDQNRSLRVQKIKEKFHCYAPQVCSSICCTALARNLRQHTEEDGSFVQESSAISTSFWVNSMFSGISAEQNGQGDSLGAHVVGGICSSLPTIIRSKKLFVSSSLYGALQSRKYALEYRHAGLSETAKDTAIAIGCSSACNMVFGMIDQFGQKQEKESEKAAAGIIGHEISEGVKGTVKGVAIAATGSVLGSLLGKAVGFVVNRPSVKKWL